MGPRRHAGLRSVSSQDHGLVVADAERQSAADLVDDEQVAALAPRASRAVAEQVPGLRGEPDDDLAGRAGRPDSSRRMSGFATRSDRLRRRRRVFLIFVLAPGRRPVVGDRGGHDHGVGVRRAASSTASRSWAADVTRTTLAPAGSARRHVGGHQGDLGAAGGGRRGQRVALPPGGPVAEEPDRIELLPGAARRRPRPGARSGPARARRRRGPAGPDATREQLGGLRQPARARCRRR